MSKLCPKCNTDKELSEFRPNSKRKDGLQAYCISCDKEFQSEWYLKNKEKCIKKAKERNKKFEEIGKGYIINYLKSHPCVDCGEGDIVVLEFDHQKDKKYAISEIIRKGYKLEIIQKEIEKCEVRCANCHKRRTAKQFNWYKIRPLT